MKNPHLQRMSELYVELTMGLSEEDFIRRVMEDLEQIPAETEEARKHKAVCMQGFQSILANISEPGGNVTDELGDQVEAWLKNPKT